METQRKLPILSPSPSTRLREAAPCRKQSVGRCWTNPPTNRAPVSNESTPESTRSTPSSRPNCWAPNHPSSSAANGRDRWQLTVPERDSRYQPALRMLRSPNSRVRVKQRYYLELKYLAINRNHLSRRLTRLTYCRLLVDTNSLRCLSAEALVTLSRSASYVCVEFSSEFVHRVGTRCGGKSILIIRLCSVVTPEIREVRGH